MEPLMTGGRAQTNTIMPRRKDPPGVPDHTDTATAKPPIMPMIVTIATKASVLTTTFRKSGLAKSAA